MKGVLYLLPSPIADDNFSELLYPLLEKTVNSLNEFIVEDLKTARRTLRKAGYKGDFDKTIFHLLNEHSNVNNISAYLNSSEKGKNIGLMSDAGMPAIADPGSELIQLAHRKNIRVIPLYGQSSIFLALAASGLNGQRFCFHGYLPKEQGERRKELKKIEKNILEKLQTHIFIETPYRNNHVIEDILSVCAPDLLLCIASDISGKNEWIITKPVGSWKKEILPDFKKTPAVFLLGK